VSSGVRTVTGVATSITAFVGRTLRGPVNDPVRVQSFGEFERRFGGLWRDSTLSYSLQQFFQNGGTDALVVRVHNGAAAATLTLAAGFNLIAANPGKWARSCGCASITTPDPISLPTLLTACSIFRCATLVRVRRAFPKSLHRSQ